HPSGVIILLPSCGCQPERTEAGNHWVSYSRDLLEGFSSLECYTLIHKIRSDSVEECLRSLYGFLHPVYFPDREDVIVCRPAACLLLGQGLGPFFLKFPGPNQYFPEQAPDRCVAFCVHIMD